MSPQSSACQHRALAVAVAAALLLMLLIASLAPAGAMAGAWTLVSCAQPNGQPAPTDGWSTSATGTVGPDSGDTNTCPQGGQLSAITSGEAPQHAYDGPEWVFTAPAGSTIAGGTLTAMLTARHGQAWLATPNESYDAADVLANCQYNLSCGQAGTLSGTFPITHTGGTHLYAVAVCVAESEGSTVCPALGGTDASVAISAASIQLENSATPAASGFTGPALTGTGHGTEDLDLTATDPGGPGVYNITARIDNTIVYSGTPDNNGGRCSSLANNAGALVFDSAQPCKQSETVQLPLNTALVGDGHHSLKVTVEDGAQNTSLVYDATITTQNATNTTLGGLPGPGNPDLLGAPNGNGASEQAQLHLGVRKALTRSYRRRSLRISGRLLSSQGQPIKDALLSVTQTLPGGSPQKLASVRTATDGSFIAGVPNGPSRAITISYRAYSTDTSYAATETVTESVQAGVKLLITPRETNPSGTILLAGQVSGPVPKAGVIVHLLVHYRGRWEPFRTPRTDSAGHFDVPYQFQGALGRFPFRAEVPSGQANFPFTNGRSKAIAVATR